MIIEVHMPVLGLTMEEGTVLEWSKAVGDKVATDETLLVVETDKAASDVPSPAAGILARIVAKEGDTIPVKELIAYLAETEADLANVPQGAPAAAPPSEAPDTTAAATLPFSLAASAEAFAARVAPATPATLPPSPAVPSGRVFASPRARAHAAALGVDIATVAPRGERIIKQDVVRAADAAAQQEPSARLTPLAARLAAELGIDLAALAASPEARVRAADLLLAMSLAPEAASAATPAAAGAVPVTKTPNRVRRITAERMTLSAQTAPQVTYQMRCDMTKAVQLRTELKAEAETRGVRLSLDAMFVRAVATALMEYPDANSQWVEGEGIRTYPEAHVGVAVDLGENGLIVPVVRSANSRGLFAICAELDRLVMLAREGKLGPDDFRGGTFTISNLGLLGIETFNPIINLPEAAILAIGVITPTLVPEGGQTVERQMAVLALTTDHRILDGAPSARFLGRIRALMEQPLLLLEKGL